MEQYFENILRKKVNDPNYEFGLISNNDLKNYPNFLYKYRDCKSEYNFEMIETDYLWADYPKNFDDKTDSRIRFRIISDIPKIVRWIYDHLPEIIYYNIEPKGMQPIKNGKTLNDYINARDRFKDKSGKINKKIMEKEMNKELQFLDTADAEKVRETIAKINGPDFEKEFKTAFMTVYTELVNHLRNVQKVCCLSERKDNHKMWEDFADKYRGFVIEYDISKIANSMELSEILYNTFPVTYRKTTPKVPLLPFIEELYQKTLYNKEIDILDSKTQLVKQLFYKKKDYNPEEEWRVLSLTHKISFPIISKVYIGSDISKNDEERLINICKNKSIPVYKQCFNSISTKMDFEEINYGGASC